MAGARIEVRSKGALLDGSAGAKVEAATRKHLQGVLRYGRDRVRAGVPVDQGALRDSIVYRTRSRRGRVEGEIFSSFPASKQVIVATMNYGRRAGSRMPPSGALLDWMERRGIPARLEFVVRRSIAVHGITARLFFERGFAQIKGLLAPSRNVLGAEIVRALR